MSREPLTRQSYREEKKRQEKGKESEEDSQDIPDSRTQEKREGRRGSRMENFKTSLHETLQEKTDAFFTIEGHTNLDHFLNLGICLFIIGIIIVTVIALFF